MLNEAAAIAPSLARILRGDWLLIGIGNDLRGDDAFGTILARRLLREGFPALDAGTCPENLTGPILAAAPDQLIFADAADMGAAVGTLCLLDPLEAPASSPSTHDPGMGLLLAYLGERRKTSTTILAVQLGTRALGEPMTAEVRESLNGLVELFRRHRAGERAPYGWGHPRPSDPSHTAALRSTATPRATPVPGSPVVGRT